jgi:hypothetical protein
MEELPLLSRVEAAHSVATTPHIALIIKLTGLRRLPGCLAF